MLFTTDEKKSGLMIDPTEVLHLYETG